MRKFIARHAKKVVGVLTGFDRVLFRGHLMNLCHEKGLRMFLCTQSALLKDFGRFAQAVTGLIRTASSQVTQDAGAPEEYLNSSSIRKEDVAKSIIAKRGIDEGLVCVLSAVEPCLSWQIFRSRAEKTQQPQRRLRKCLHLYYYFLDRDFGLMHVRIQTWMPYTIQVCVNGREWLARQLNHAGISHVQAGNCFLRIDDMDAAQQLMDRLVASKWPKVLDDFVYRANPAMATIIDAANGPYYWTAHQTEWATDVLFRRPADLAAIYPQLSRHAISDFNTKDVLRFLGKTVTPRFKGEVLSDYKHRLEGVRVKHSVAANSVKMYDKAGSVLRVETTIQYPKEFKVLRRAQGDPDSKLTLRPIRKGVIDIKARADASNQVNERYLDALAVADCNQKLQQLLDPVLKRTKLGDQSVRALRPWSEPDQPLLLAISSGTFLVGGFRNQDILRQLHPDITDKDERRRLSARITRLLRLLRAHGIIERKAGTYRYHVTITGRRLIGAVIAVSGSSISKLRQSA